METAASGDQLLEAAVVLIAARAAGANAQEYAAQADLLAERGWHGRATALTILGLEESVKAWVLSVAAAGLIPRTRKTLIKILSFHPNKQTFAPLLELAVDVVQRMGDPAETQSFPTSAPTVEEVRANKDLVPAIRELVAQMIRALDLELANGTDVRGMIESRVQSAQEREVDAVKQRGLYVDLSNGSELSTPSEIDEGMYRLWRDRLRLVCAFSDTLADSLNEAQLAGSAELLRAVCADPVVAALIKRAPSS